MSDNEPIDIRAKVIESTLDVFDTMLGMQVEYTETTTADSPQAEYMVGAVDFAGGIVGSIGIRVSTEFARLMTANMQGVEIEECQDLEEIKDLLAEISNIIGGNLKSAFNDAGYACVISTPAITYGSDFCIESLNTEKTERFVFLYGQNTVLIDLGIKTIQTGTDDGTQEMTAEAEASSNPNLESLNPLNLKDKVCSSVCEVFSEMFSLKLELTESVAASKQEGTRNVGAVSLAGDVAGHLSIHIMDGFSKRMVANKHDMGTDALEGSAEIKDSIAELSIVIGGNLKSMFTEAGLSCEMSGSSLTTGSDFTIESLNMEKYERYAFQNDEDIIFVELGIKLGEHLQIENRRGKEVHYTVDEQTSEMDDLLQSLNQEVGTDPAMQTAPADDTAPESFEAMPSQESDEAGAYQDPQHTSHLIDGGDLDLILDIPIEITVELGRTRLKIHDLLNLGPGSAVTLKKLDSEPVDIFANETLIARGEVVIQKEKYGIRVTEIATRMDRIKSLS